METAALEGGEAVAGEPHTASRHQRLRSAAAARGIPLPTILATCGIVVAIYLAGALIAGGVVFAGFADLGLPFPLLWALWVALVDFLPMVGGALAGIPTVLFATVHSLTDGIVMAVVFVAYQELENHVLNPLIMSRTVKVNALLVLLAVLFGTSMGDWVGGVFGAFVAALLSIPCAAALQVIVKEIWRTTAPGSG